MKGQWQVLTLRGKMDIITAKGIKIRVAIKAHWPTWIYGNFRGEIDGNLIRMLFDLYNKKIESSTADISGAVKKSPCF